MLATGDEFGSNKKMRIGKFIFFIRIWQQDADPDVGWSLYLMIGQMFPLYEAHAAQLTRVGPQLST